MKVGIWFEIHPNAPWKYEGLGRLLRYVLSGIDPKADVSFELGVPCWVEKSEVRSFLEDLNPEQRQKIKIVYASTAPNPVVAWYLRRESRRTAQPGAARPRWRLFGRPRDLTPAESEPRPRILARRLAKLGANPIYTAAAALLAFAALLLSPLAAIALVVRRLLGIVLRAFRYVAFRLERVIVGTALDPDQPLDRWRRLPWFLRLPTAPLYRIWLRYSGVLHAAMIELVPMELARQARELSLRRNVDCWYIPHIGYLSGMHLEGRRVFLFADYVLHDAPTDFHPDLIAAVRGNVERVLGRADHVIAMSHHVAERHLAGVFGFDKSRITVVPHGFASLAPTFAPTRSVPIALGRSIQRIEKSPQSLAQSANIITDHLKQRQRAVDREGGLYKRFVFPALCEMDFTGGGYVLISTQNRPYKNTLGVIRALEMYNRTSSRPLRLIMTGDYGIDDRNHPIGSYLVANGLLLDVIAIPRVPNDVHAALYHCADVAVHASFFEGGQGTFVFNEAVSLGTPTLVSRSLAHDEGFGPFRDYERFAFNPYDASELAALLETWMNDWPALWAMQFEIADAMARTRDWKAAHADYLKAFQTAIAAGGRKKAGR